jgi:hypothetical protein
MKWGLLLGSALSVAMGLMGCGGGSEAPKNDKKEGDKAAAAQPGEKTLDINPDSTPDQVVTGLLEAMKSGDKEAKEALLTDKAREETAKHNMPVHTLAMPNTEYQVGKPKYLEKNPNGAHVSCILTETFEDGTKQDHQIVWVLRREPEHGWRIAGMAVELMPGTQPQFLNFEDPLDMQKKMEEAAAALAQQEQSASQGTENQSVEPASNNSPIEGTVQARTPLPGAGKIQKR